jgi:hypothetical protein
MQTEDLFGTPHPTGIGARSGAVETRVPVAELLNKVLELGASDLHLAAGAKPTVRVHGALRQLDDYPRLMPNETQAMLYSILTQRQRGTAGDRAGAGLRPLPTGQGPLPAQRLLPARRHRRRVPDDP